MLISSLGGYDNISKKCNELVSDVSKKFCTLICINIWKINDLILRSINMLKIFRYTD